MDRYSPPSFLAESARVNSLESYRAMYEQSIRDPLYFWGEQARARLRWQHEFQEVMDCDFSEGEIGWFLGGKLNVCENCVDRHVAAGHGDQIAILWEGDEPGHTRAISYRQLQREVCRLANVLRNYGLQKGDRVAIYLPMIPEAAFAMLACCRLGIVHTVV